jgi:hypothetical protein
MCAAAWIATRLYRARLLGDRALVFGAAAWLAAVLALYGVLAWILDTPHIGHFFLVLLAVLAVPLARSSAVLLALASNRHRGTVPPAPRSVDGRRPALHAALLVLAVPVALAVVTCVSFHARNRDNGAFVSSGEERTYRLEASYNFDPTSFYADGLSIGRGVAFLLSCAMPDRIAAVGLVASAQFLPWSACEDQRPVPMIAFHGTDDWFTRYLGGRSWVARDHVFPSIPTFTATWASRNRCAASPAESRVTADVTRPAYRGCANDADVVLYTIHGGGHTWPGGGRMPEWFAGKTSTGVDATRQAWAFVRAHSLAR